MQNTKGLAGAICPFKVKFALASRRFHCPSRSLPSNLPPPACLGQNTQLRCRLFRRTRRRIEKIAQEEICVFDRCCAPRRCFPIGGVAHLQGRSERFRGNTPEGGGSRQAARLPAKPHSAHHADASLQSRRDRDRRHV